MESLDDCGEQIGFCQQLGGVGASVECSDGVSHSMNIHDSQRHLIQVPFLNCADQVLRFLLRQLQNDLFISLVKGDLKCGIAGHFIGTVCSGLFRFRRCFGLGTSHV